jgi:hypothetical protein
MIIGRVCAETGWSYEQYLTQPEWLLDSVAIKIEITERVQRQRHEQLIDLIRNQR